MYHSRTNERYGVSTHGSLAGADSTDNASFNSILAVSTHGSLAGADIYSHITNTSHNVSTHGSLAGADSKNSHFQETFHKKKNAFSCFSNFFITFFYNIRFDLKK